MLSVVVSLVVALRPHSESVQFKSFLSDFGQRFKIALQTMFLVSKHALNCTCFKGRYYQNKK